MFCHRFFEMQAAIAQAKADADRVRRDFDNLKRMQQQEIEERLGKELAMLQKEVAAAKPKAATDISRAQVIHCARALYANTLHRTFRHNTSATAVSAPHL